jgi:hypothetical protein
MNCKQCLNKYNIKNRIPKIIIPCGHMLCKKCIDEQDETYCSICNEKGIFNFLFFFLLKI